MTILILDPFSGIAGDMLLGALVSVGLDRDWVRGLPRELALDGVGVTIRDTDRRGIGCVKVDFEIPPQPHGRHLSQILAIIERSSAPPEVQRRAAAAFTDLATVEARIHGVTVAEVHLHEVGAVDAILDIVGGIWGVFLLGVTEVYNNPVALGEGSVTAEHGVLPVPAPATLELLQGQHVTQGPPGSGELTTPTGAVLLKALSAGSPPAGYVPLRAGYGAGTRDTSPRPNVLRAILAERADGTSARSDKLVLLSADVDDMTPEDLGFALDVIRESGALDVVAHPLLMKHGRPGWRVEALADLDRAASIEEGMFLELSTIGIKHFAISRSALPRHTDILRVAGHEVRMKVVALPRGGTRVKPEFVDVKRLALAHGVSTFEARRMIETAARERDEELSADG